MSSGTLMTSAREYETVADLVVVQEGLVVLVHLARVQLACAPALDAVRRAPRASGAGTPRLRAPNHGALRAALHNLPATSSATC